MKGNGCGMLVEVVTSTNGIVIFLGVTFPSRNGLLSMVESNATHYSLTSLITYIYICCKSNEPEGSVFLFFNYAFGDGSRFKD